MLPFEVKSKLEDSIKEAQCLVSEFAPGGDHYSLVVIAAQFESLSLLKRHRLVMSVFEKEIESQEIHALTLKAFTPNEWEKEKENPLYSAYL
jgi:acid stress-induced BolA-like protein IbaG/YrbA